MEAKTALLSLVNDRQFERIPGLTWYPWVGCKYFTAKRRVLIVAESHYNTGENVEQANERTKREKWNTRDIVQTYSIEDYGSGTTYGNLFRCLFKTNDIKKEARENIWTNLAFFNFVQRPMNYNGSQWQKERPSDKDFHAGWKVFFEVIKILRPTDCIFVGVAAADRFNDCAKENNWNYIGVEWRKVDKIRNYARHFSLSIDDYKIDCIAIQHTSHHFSWYAWHSYLTMTNKAMMEYLSFLVPESKFTNEKEECKDHKEIPNPPYWLKHKPIYCCDYSKIDPKADLKYISIGRAQWNNKSALSAKAFRYVTDRWSRMSEEVPVSRLSEMAVVLLSAIRATQIQRANQFQRMNIKMTPSYLNEAFVAEEYEFLENQFDKDKESLRKSLSAIKRLINEIDLDNI